MNSRETKSPGLDWNNISGTVPDAAIEVHRNLGPGTIIRRQFPKK
jgi:hypothetical protein